MGKRLRVVIVRSNPVAPDPRVEKMAETLARAGYHVTVLAWGQNKPFQQCEEKPWGKIERIRTPGLSSRGLKNLPNLLRWQLNLARWLWKHRREVDVIHACDFDTVIPAILIGRVFAKKVVYDIFDFYADMLLNTPNWAKKIIRFVDLKVMNHADAVILADESRTQQISGAHPKKVVVVNNTPRWEAISANAEEQKNRLGFRIVYVGLLQRERGLFEMIEVIRHHPEWVLDIGGYGGDEAEIRAKAEGLPNVHFHGRMLYEDALALMAQADVLFATYDPRIPNHRYSSPNKVFEAMALGKPIIVARGMGIDTLVERYELGIVVNYGNAEELEQALSRIASWSLQVKATFKERAQELYKSHFSWEIMAQRLLDLYKSLTS